MLILLIEARIWESLSGKRHYPIKTRVIIGQRSPITLHLFTLYQSYRAPVQLQEKRYPQPRGCFPLLLHCSRNNDYFQLSSRGVGQLYWPGLRKPRHCAHPFSFRDAPSRVGVAFSRQHYAHCSIRRCKRSTPERPYICRLRVLRRLMNPSTMPFDHGLSMPARTALASCRRPRAQRVILS